MSRQSQDKIVLLGKTDNGKGLLYEALQKNAAGNVQYLLSEDFRLADYGLKSYNTFILVIDGHGKNIKMQIQQALINIRMAGLLLKKMHVVLNEKGTPIRSEENLLGFRDILCEQYGLDGNVIQFHEGSITLETNNPLIEGLIGVAPKPEGNLTGFGKLFSKQLPSDVKQVMESQAGFFV